jgi:hypothetical protein
MKKIPELLDFYIEECNGDNEFTIPENQNPLRIGGES